MLLAGFCLGECSQVGSDHGRLDLFYLCERATQTRGLWTNCNGQSLLQPQATQSLSALLQVPVCDRGTVLQGRVGPSCTALIIVPHQLQGFLGRLARGEDICRMGGSFEVARQPHDFDVFCWRLSWTLTPISLGRSLRCTKTQSASSLGSWSPRVHDDAKAHSCSPTTTICTLKPATGSGLSLRPSNLHLSRTVPWS